MMQREFKDARAQALYTKALEIHDLVDHILEVAPDDVEDPRMLKHDIDAMRADAMMIPAKIAGAEGGRLYAIRMENAAIIRKCGNDLVLGLRGLETSGFHAPAYFDLLRAEMAEFRKLFVAWVDGFDRSLYYVDEWGLFNPPGVKPDDESPDLDFGDEDDV